MIYIAGITIAVFIEFLLLSKKNKFEGDIILSLWIFSIAVQLFFFYLFVNDELFRFPIVLGFEQPIPLLQGPFLYWYVGSLTDQLPTNKKIVLIHFLPAIASYVYLIPYFLLSYDQKIAVYVQKGAGFETFESMKFVAIILSGILYISWSGLLLAHHKRHILDQFSYQKKVDLQWLLILTWGMGIIWFLIIFSDTILFGGVAVFVFLIGFFGIRQQRIFTHHPEEVITPDAGAKEEEKDKYSKSGLTEEMSETIYQSLNSMMTAELLHRNKDLSLDELASRLNIHPNYLSQVINEREKKNFYDFVNSYRIEEFKQLIANPKNRHLTLLSLAFDCGFNSKSSFNRSFKKSTGKTPSEYVSQL